MKYSISYFYQIRFFKPNQIPISTALWDPKWYHQFTNDNEVIFRDNHKIVNGLRAKSLNPTTSECAHECHWKGQEHCPFRDHYLEHLRSMNFKTFKNNLENFINEVVCKEWYSDIKEPEVVLIVYETPDNPCSERAGLIQWFKENGIVLEEWAPQELPSQKQKMVKLL